MAIFVLPLFRSFPSPTDNTTMIQTAIGLDFRPSAHNVSSLLEIIYLCVLLIELFLTGVIITSVLLGMMCFTILVPFLAIYSFNLENYEQEKNQRC
jgi:hypothetical protein